MSLRTPDLFATGLVPSDKDRTAPAAEAPAKIQPQLASDQLFSTADWFLANGRTARSMATTIHCEQAALSPFRRAVLNLVGRRVKR